MAVESMLNSLKVLGGAQEACRLGAKWFGQGVLLFRWPGPARRVPAKSPLISAMIPGARHWRDTMAKPNHDAKSQALWRYRQIEPCCTRISKGQAGRADQAAEQHCGGLAFGPE